jgi:plastocyanin
VTWARTRAVLPIVLLVLGAACGSDATNTTAASGSPPTSSGPASPSPSPSPLVVPKGCSPDGSALEIATVNNYWADSDGHSIAPGEACLAVRGGPFAVTVHNDVRGEGIGAPNHNFAVFTDSSASEALFTGDIVYTGASKTYHVPKLPAGTYLFHCDIHPQTMYGVLVVT